MTTIQDLREIAQLLDAGIEFAAFIVFFVLAWNIGRVVKLLKRILAELRNIDGTLRRKENEGGSK